MPAPLHSRCGKGMSRAYGNCGPSLTVASSSCQSGAGKSALINAVFGVEGATGLRRNTFRGRPNDVERILVEYRGDWNKLERQLERTGPLFQAFMRPHALRTPKQVATSATDPRYKTTIADLVNLAFELTKIEKVWIEMVIAQRSNTQASIDTSIRYSRGLISYIFLGFTMRSVLEVLQKDIDNVWNMHDPEKVCDIQIAGEAPPLFLANVQHLQRALGLIISSGGNLSDEATYALTSTPRMNCETFSTAIVIAGSTAVFVLFAEWVRGTYKKTYDPRKSSVRCLVAFIVDLMLTMNTMFYLVLSRGQTPIKIALVNSALRIYNSRKAPVHASIGAWVDRWGTFGHLDADIVIKTIADIIMDNRHYNG
ncbi:hypothetical protein B0H17DRAFT_1188266 [Mycena rosella]|uniref:G domain-containing protein n=1 Tax=Mycena rosella TaxID=1033263 RepID=A0AAD7FHB5_MYCRO|nr:hypothetical protein B0H17DRAFT_1188266 [Mycena rosella]